MLHERIKTETNQHHKDAEKHSYGKEIMSKTLNRNQYIQLLIANYSYIKSWEKEWDNTSLSIPSELALESRKKTHLLEQDLRQLGIDPGTIQGYPLNQATSFPEFMGRMYVIEGSTLGGAMIEKQLQLNPDLTNASFTFYGGYGKDLIPNWKTFLAQLNTIDDELEMETAIESAKQCFKAVEQCFITAKQQALS